MEQSLSGIYSFIMWKAFPLANEIDPRQGNEYYFVELLYGNMGNMRR